MDNNVVDDTDMNGKGMEELECAVKVLLSLDLDLAYSSEKLVNLHVLLMQVWARENVFEAMAMGKDHISADSIEKALVFDLLSGILDSEVREIENFMDTLQAEIVDAHKKISSCSHLRELFNVMEEKLIDCEESLKQSQEQVLKMNTQLAKFQRVFLEFEYQNGKNDENIDSRENGQLSNINLKLKMPAVRQQRHILRVLDKSLERELDLEKKLLEIRQSEEELKLKMHLTEQVGFCMEEAAGAIYGRFLEAENLAEVLMGISKELVGRLQIAQFNLNGSIQREAEAKYKLLDCMEQLKAKETASQRLEKINSEPCVSQREQTTSIKVNFDESEVFTLREKIQLLEEQLKESELQLKNAHASNEAMQEQLSGMDNLIESLKEGILKAESKAESAEGKLTLLTETNLELTEEMGFLKDSTTEKASSLEKQLRDLQIQLQHAKASSEASQEQQNMLYSAIWDMETLIEELKSKVSKAESKTENAEEQIIILSETNFELNKELSFLRDKMDCLEKTLHQVKCEKTASAEDISIRTRLIMDMVMQLAFERERIQKQLYSLTEDNRILVEKIQKAKNNASVIMYGNGDGEEKDFLFVKHNSATASQAKTFKETVTEPLQKSQVDEPSKDSPEPETEVETSVSAKDAANVVSELGAVNVVGERRLDLIYIFVAVLVLLIPVATIYLFNKKLIMDDVFNG